MKQFAFLVVVVLAIIPQGYGLKCHVCQANNQGDIGCQNTTKVTCSAPNDRCFTLRTMTEMNMGGAASMKMTSEIRNCAVRAMVCTEAYKQKMCQRSNSTGDLKSCNYSCCDGDLCNDGTTPPGSGLSPSKPASNESLSCYECLQNSTGTPSISCSAPKQKKCGEVAPGMRYDRCMTVKSTVKNPITGALVEQEQKDCGLSSLCSGNMACNSMNSTGNYVKCDAQCCEGNLCNGVVGPSPTGPKAGQTPLAVSGILVLISIIMALLFK